MGESKEGILVRIEERHEGGREKGVCEECGLEIKLCFEEIGKQFSET